MKKLFKTALLATLAVLMAIAPALLPPGCPLAQAARKSRKKRTRGERFVNIITPEIQNAIQQAINNEFPLAGVKPEDVKTIESSHYIILTNCPKVSEYYTNLLEQVYAFTKKEFKLKPVKGFLFAFVFSSKREYARFLVNKFNVPLESAMKTGGLTAQGVFYTFNNKNAKRTLVHEATHQIVYMRLGVRGGGSWLQEGFAVYIEKKFLGEKPSAPMKKRISADKYYYFYDFVALKSLIFDKKGYGRLNYEQAGSMVDYMINGRYRRYFENYLEQLRKKPSPAKDIAISNIEKGFRISLFRFENGWRLFCKAKVRKKMPREK